MHDVCTEVRKPDSKHDLLFSAVGGEIREFMELRSHIRKPKTTPNLRHWRADADEFPYNHTNFLQNSVQ